MVDEIVYPPDSLPDPMDVVWCFFPYHEKRGVPATKPHPALVFETSEFLDGRFAVRVAFGTSAKKPRFDDGTHFKVSNYNALHLAGLNRVTTFDLGRVKYLPWTSRWFASPDPSKYASPKIGSIEADGQAILRAILKIREAKGLSVPR